MATGTWSCLRSRAAPTGSRPRRPSPGSSSWSPAAPATSAPSSPQRLLDRGYRVRILDRLYWGRGPIAPILDRIELVEADVRDMPASALDGVDARDPPGRPLERPDGRVRPRGELADERHRHGDARARNCVDRDVERLVFASSCSLYDGLPPGMHDETAPIKPRGAYATSKRYGEEALLDARRRGPVPGDPAQRHRLRPQPAHALRPRGQHVRQGRAAARASSRCTAAAGCGGRWWTCATSPTR